MFAVPFDEIATIFGRSPNAAKMLASRARHKVQGSEPTADADPPRQRAVVDAFLAASRNGEFDALVALLDPNVVLQADATGDDRVAVWNTVRAAPDAAFCVPGAFDAQVTLPFGVMRAEDGLGFPFGDLLVHTWDLARAIGADDHLLGEACAIVLAQLEPIDALIRGPGPSDPNSNRSQPPIAKTSC